jgi:hypothetical protein
VIQDLIGTNDFGVGIGEQRKIDFAAVRERFQDALGVIADCRELDPLFLESRLRILQLNQLPFAVWSPIGRTKEQ